MSVTRPIPPIVRAPCNARPRFLLLSPNGTEFAIASVSLTVLSARGDCEVGVMLAEIMGNQSWCCSARLSSGSRTTSSSLPSFLKSPQSLPSCDKRNLKGRSVRGPQLRSADLADTCPSLFLPTALLPDESVPGRLAACLTEKRFVVLAMLASGRPQIACACLVRDALPKRAVNRFLTAGRLERGKLLSFHA
jgi:hypothetical protein